MIEEQMQENVETTEDETSDVDDDIVSEALDLGWRPKEKFSGDDDKWVDAAEYVRRTKEEVPIIKAQAKKDRMKVKQFESEQKRLMQLLEKAAEREKKAEEKGYASAKKELEKKQEEAVELGDVDEFRRIEQEKARLAKEQAEAAKYYESNQTNNQIHPDIVDWASNNSWYTSDQELGFEMNKAVKEVLQYSPHLQNEPSQYLAIAEKQVRKNNPEKFGGKKMTQSVEGGNRGSTLNNNTRKGKLSINDLKPQDRAILQKHTRPGGLYEKPEDQKRFIEQVVKSYGG